MFEFLAVDSFESLRDGNAQFALILDTCLLFFYILPFGLRPQGRQPHWIFVTYTIILVKVHQSIRVVLTCIFPFKSLRMGIYTLSGTLSAWKLIYFTVVRVKWHGIKQWAQQKFWFESNLKFYCRPTHPNQYRYGFKPKKFLHLYVIHCSFESALCRMTLPFHDIWICFEQIKWTSIIHGSVDTKYSEKYIYTKVIICIYRGYIARTFGSESIWASAIHCENAVSSRI